MLRTFLYLGRNGMAAAEDFGMGMLLVCLTALTLGRHIEWWWPLMGVPLGVLADSLLILRIKRGSVGNFNHHTMWTHWPLVMVPGCTAVAYAVAWALGLDATFWATATAACLLWHYLHDTPPLGMEGVQWFAPFIKRYVSYRGFEERSPSSTHYEEWMRRYWMRPSWLSVLELSVASVAFLATGILAHWNMLACIALLVVAWVAVAFVWSKRTQAL